MGTIGAGTQTATSLELSDELLQRARAHLDEMTQRMLFVFVRVTLKTRGTYTYRTVHADIVTQINKDYWGAEGIIHDTNPSGDEEEDPTHLVYTNGPELWRYSVDTHLREWLQFPSCAFFDRFIPSEPTSSVRVVLAERDRHQVVAVGRRAVEDLAVIYGAIYQNISSKLHMHLSCPRWADVRTFAKRFEALRSRLRKEDERRIDAIHELHK